MAERSCEVRSFDQGRERGMGSVVSNPRKKGPRRPGASRDRSGPFVRSGPHVAYGYSSRLAIEKTFFVTGE